MLAWDYTITLLLVRLLTKWLVLSLMRIDFKIGYMRLGTLKVYCHLQL